MRKVLLALCWLTPALAFGQAEELTNPGSVNAVQERGYRMGHELTFGVGVLPWDAFYKGVTVGVGYTAHFSDYFAWQVARGAYSFNVNTGLADQLERDFGVLPTAFDRVNWMVESDFIWTPFYGKWAFHNRSVLHVEVFFLAGLSLFKFDLTSSSGGSSLLSLAGSFKPAANFGVGIRFFGTKVLSWRLDITDNVVVNSGKITNVPMIQLAAAINLGAGE